MSTDVLQKGDTVLFIAQKQPLPRSCYADMYTLGIVDAASATIALVRDLCGQQHYVYTRDIKKYPFTAPQQS